MHIGLTQQNTRCGDSTCESGKQQVDGAPAVETKTKFIEVRLEYRTTAMVSTQEEGFEVADRLVQPLQIAACGIKDLPMEIYAGQASVTGVTVTLNSCALSETLVHKFL